MSDIDIIWWPSLINHRSSVGLHDRSWNYNHIQQATLTNMHINTYSPWPPCMVNHYTEYINVEYSCYLDLVYNYILKNIKGNPGIYICNRLTLLAYE